MRLVGREDEQRQLREYAAADEPDFVVVYGRRRVGKTFLVREVFDDRFTFYATGLMGGSKAEQLAEFNRALNRYGTREFPPAADWLTAFWQLRDLVEADPRLGKKVIFLDEMPWMDTPKSKFLMGLEAFWNGWASGRADILLVVCGSAAAWITRKLFRNRGGLYNRVTHRIWLRPFTLQETEALLAARGIVFSRLQIAETYMVFGGIPHYLCQLERGLSPAQNVDRLCFARGAPLRDEFDQLYASVFAQAQRHVDVVEAIGRKNRGLTRDEIIAATRLTDGGSLSRVLDELERSDLLRRYYGFGKRERDSLYQLSDPFSHFALRFLRSGAVTDENYWANDDTSGARNAWRGYAFEQVCLAHLPQIKAKLGISGVATTTASWLGQRDGQKAQIDLVLARRDGVINLCEMKFADREYEITKAYADRLRQQRWAFADHAPKSAALHTTLVTPYGVKRNIHWSEVQAEVTLDDLFA
ncbi:MAG: ATP-binding protein [Propionibacteriaceae bacterium]|jgi:hypothetical protein|nr:ATP-binding protein [Propionibacteriaceae bacterium]